MNTKASIKSLIHGQKTEYLPSGFWHHFASHQWSGDAAVEAHCDFLADTGVDILKIMNENLYQLDEPVQKASDWNSIRPQKLSSAFFQKELDVVKRILEKIGSDTYTLITIHGVYASAFHTFNHPDEWFARNNVVEAHIMENPKAVANGLAAIADSLLEFADACLGFGVDGVYYAALGAESYRAFAGDLFREVVRPADLRFLNGVKHRQADTFVHICKDRIDFSQYADYPGDVFNWATHDNDFTLHQGWELFGRPILGGMDDRSGAMVSGSHEDIAREVRRVKDEMAHIPFILGSDCTLPGDIDGARIRAAVRAANG